MLCRLLQCLQPEMDATPVREVVVVDNSPEASGRNVVDDWQQSCRVPVRFVHVPVPDLVNARNTAVNTAAGEFVALIDDDEWPETGWLGQLLAVQEKSGSDVVFGPVLPHFDDDVPEWVRRCGFFQPRSYLDCGRVAANAGYTGNVLIRRSVLSGMRGPFDPAFSQTGGEDAMLFHDLQARGVRMAWARHAAVSEAVPLARANLRWLVRRAYWGGQTYARVCLFRESGWRCWRTRTRIALRAILLGAMASAVTAALLPFSLHRSARWMSIAAAQAGKLSAIMGQHCRLYANTASPAIR